MELTKTNERAVALERKVENLEQIFNTAEKTIIEVEKSEIICQELDDEFLMLKEDFQIVRTTILSTIQRAKNVLDMLSTNIELDPTASGSLISSYSELVNSINNSGKLLGDLNKTLIDIKQKSSSQLENNETAKKDKVLAVSEITRLIANNKL